MSHLADHAFAARVLAESLQVEWDSVREDNPARPVLLHLSLALHGAANRMEIEVRARATNLPAACTFDHAKMPGPKCIACGAPRPSTK